MTDRVYFANGSQLGFQTLVSNPLFRFQLTIFVSKLPLPNSFGLRSPYKAGKSGRHPRSIIVRYLLRQMAT